MGEFALRLALGAGPETALEQCGLTNATSGWATIPDWEVSSAASSATLHYWTF